LSLRLGIFVDGLRKRANKHCQSSSDFKAKLTECEIRVNKICFEILRLFFFLHEEKVTQNYFHGSFNSHLVCDEMMPIKYRNTEVLFFVPKFDVTG
jgi:hypothetical protein